MAANDREMGHVDSLLAVLFDQRHARAAVQIAREQRGDMVQVPPVDFIDDHLGGKGRGAGERSRYTVRWKRNGLPLSFLSEPEWAAHQVTGQHALQQRHGPALQGFRQNGVVGVCKGVDANLPRLFPRQTLLQIEAAADEWMRNEHKASSIFA